MAAKAVKKRKDILANPGEFNVSDLFSAGLFPVEPDGRINLKKPGYFLLNPDSWEENKAGGWVHHSSPGQSDPILQWLSSGPRTVSFDALVTADISAEKAEEKPAKEDDPIKAALEYIGDTAASFFKTTVPKPQPSSKNKVNSSREVLDISNYLNYYRSLLYPVYDRVNDPKSLNHSPPLLVLFAGSSISNSSYDINGKIKNSQDLWVLNNLKIRITKQMPNLAPMEAVVSFQLIQYTIKSRHRNFYTR